MLELDAAAKLELEAAATELLLEALTLTSLDPAAELLLAALKLEFPSCAARLELLVMAEDDRSRPATLELSLAAIELLALAATAAESDREKSSERMIDNTRC